MQLSEKRTRPIPRRLLLAATLGLAQQPTAHQATAQQATAQTPLKKISQAQAAYQDKPQGGLTCEACTFFRKPHTCQVVEGQISPDGWCRLFDMPD
jgi:hypothetical protein